LVKKWLELGENDGAVKFRNKSITIHFFKKNLIQKVYWNELKYILKNELKLKWIEMNWYGTSQRQNA